MFLLLLYPHVSEWDTKPYPIRCERGTNGRFVSNMIPQSLVGSPSRSVGEWPESAEGRMKHKHRRCRIFSLFCLPELPTLRNSHFCSSVTQRTFPGVVSIWKPHGRIYEQGKTELPWVAKPQIRLARLGLSPMERFPLIEIDDIIQLSLLGT
jgi:hypothetical protein